MLHKLCFWVKHILENLFVERYLSIKNKKIKKNYCVVTLMSMTIYEKCSMFNIAYEKCMNIWHGKEKHL